MSKINLSQVLEQLNWRAAIKVFDATKKISNEDWANIEEALILSPSSYGLQPWKFIVVTDQKIKEKLKPFSWNQSQITDCSHLLICLGKTELNENYVDHFIQASAEKKGLPVEKLQGYRNMIVADVINGERAKIIPEWATRQVYIALGNIMTVAAMVGVDTCPLEGIEPAQYDNVLGVNGSGYETRVACAFGYRSVNDVYSRQPKIRFSSDELLIRK